MKKFDRSAYAAKYQFATITKTFGRQNNREKQLNEEVCSAYSAKYQFTTRTKMFRRQNSVEKQLNEEDWSAYNAKYQFTTSTVRRCFVGKTVGRNS